MSQGNSIISLEAVRNPFRSRIVNDPWQLTGVDVPEIHAEAFDLCCSAMEYVREEHKGTSVLLHGEAGSGKTHLLGRLRAHLLRVGLQRQVVFISVQLQTSPQMIWRHLRRCMADDLLRPVNGGQPQFKTVIAHRLPGEQGIDRDLRTVLGFLSHDQHRADARDWLRGDMLPDFSLQRLNLPINVDDHEDPEEKARRTVSGLCQLAGQDILLVFCFDQAEALQRHVKDTVGLFEFGKVARALCDEKTGNTLLISCIQSSLLDVLFDPNTVDEADQYRLDDYGQGSLQGLSFDQATRLIAARLNSRAELRDLREARSGDDRLWPLRERDVRAFFESQTSAGGERKVVARKVLAYCAELFELGRSGAAKPVGAEELETESDEAFLDRTWAKREEKAIGKNAPNDTDRTLQHALPWLAEIAEGDYKSQSETGDRDVHMLFLNPRGNRVEVSLCNDRSMSKLVWQLKRLREGMEGGRFQKLVLVRDPRLPIPKTAVKTREYLSTLQERGAMLVRPSAGALAALDTMRRLLSDAKAGDLANGEHTVEPTTVEEWLRDNLPGSLRDLLPGVLSPTAAAVAPAGFLDLVRERRVARLDEVAKELDHPLPSLEAWIRANGELVGILNGPPRVIFQVVPDSIAAEGQEGN